jgi:hypothetical protein
MTTTFPEVVDATLLHTIKACEGLAFRTSIQHWKPKGESVHLLAGRAFASGLEEGRKAFWEEGLDAEDAEARGFLRLMEIYGDYIPPEMGSGSNKTLDRMLGALEFYWDEFPLDRDQQNPQCDGRPIELASGKRCIEFSFAEPLDLMHPETGEPLIYCGRADMIATWAGGTYVWDDKTTSSLGGSWAQQWDLRSQFSGYAWAARKAGIKVDGVIANGVSILKTKYGRDRAPTMRPQWEVDRWYEQTLRVLQRFIRSWEAWKLSGMISAFEWNLDDSCASYGGCIQRTICKAQNPEPWLPVDFTRRKWDPLTRTETPLDPEQ